MTISSLNTHSPDVPLHVTIDPVERVVISRGWGEVSDEDLLSGRLHLAVDPVFDPTYHRIWDLSGATTLAISDEVLREFAAKSLSEQDVKRAIVCVAPPVVERAGQFAAECGKFGRFVPLFATESGAAEWIRRPRKVE